jgi:hypothetical protein
VRAAATRRPPRWLIAVILVLPAAVTGIVVIANRPEPDADRDTAPPQVPAQQSASASASAPATDYDLSAPLLPVRTAVLDQPITAPAQLPVPADCDGLLTWAAGQGPAAVNVGRFGLVVTANRLIQVTVDEVSVAVTERRAPTAKTFVQCDTSDWRNRWEPIPGDERFVEGFAVHGADYFTEAPVVTLDRSAGPVFPVEYEDPNEQLKYKLMTVAPGERVRLPFYVVRSGANVSDADLVVLTVTVRLTVNGKPVQHEVTATMHHFHEQTPQTVRYEWLTDERRWVKDRPFDPDRAAPEPRGGSYLCEVFSDAELAELLGTGIEAAGQLHGSCTWRSPRDTHVSLYSERHPDEQAAREDHAFGLANLGGVDGVTGTQLAGIGDEATLLSTGFLYARRGRDTLVLIIDDYQPAHAAFLERLARAAAARLWKAP